jgi:hypothetical protein
MIRCEPWPWELGERRAKPARKAPSAVCKCGRPRNVTNRLCSRCYMRNYRARKAAQ